MHHRRKSLVAVGKTARRSATILGVSAFVMTTGAVALEAQAQPEPEQARAALQWTQTPTGRQPAVLDDVDSHAGATWAVGRDLVADFADVRPLALRWQGGKWNVTPQPMSTNSTLNSVAVVKADDVWAVGEDRSDPQATKPLTMHWNGTAWKVVPGPPVPTGSFSDVKVGADGAVWASGWANVAGREHAAVYRYAGNTWESLTAGLEGGINGNTLAVLSKDDAWLGMNSGLAHFDGSRWERISDLPANGVPTGIVAASPNDIWLAGIDHNSGIPIGSSLLMHYNGSTWTRVAAPGGSTQLYDLALRGGRPVAVGEQFEDFGNGPAKPLVLEYDGARFVAGASPTGTDGTLTGAVVAGKRLWTVGDVFATPTELAAYAAYAK